MSSEADALIKEVEIFAQTKDGVILKSEKTVAQPLAYQIKKQGSGYFATLTFRVEEKKIKEVKSLLEKDKRILRHLILIKKPFKEMKERRIRKSLFTSDKGITPKSFLTEDKKKDEKLNPEDLNRKLDEILSE